MKNEKPFYSLVIPAYNESHRIQRTLEQSVQHITHNEWNAEIIVIDDGSSDDTAALVARFSEEHPSIQLLKNSANYGKGHSIRRGMLHASGDVIVFLDADLSFPIAEASKLIEKILGGAEVAIASRWLRPELQAARQPRYRRFFGRWYRAAVRILLGLRFSDPQCGFKAFTRAAARRIFPLQKIERWGFDAEVLFLANHFGLKTAEVAVSFSHDRGSRMKYFRDGLNMLKEVCLIRWFSVTGQYREDVASAPAVSVSAE